MAKHPITVVQMAYGEMALTALKALTEDFRFKVLAIITPKQDEPLYRGQAQLPQEKLAESNGIEIIRTDSLSELHDSIKSLAPDAVIIASFSKVIPEKTLCLSRFINVHHGDLPRQRGRANVNWAIINNEPYIVVSIHEVVPELDAGDIINQFKISIGTNDDVGDIYGKLNQELHNILPDTCFDYISGKIVCTKQDDTTVTYYGTRLPQDGHIDWNWDRSRIKRSVRALAPPFPGAYSYFNGQKFIIWKAREPESPRIYEGFVPGRIARHKKGMGVEVHTGDGLLVLTEVEIGDFRGDPAEIIRSSKITLGLNTEDLLQRISGLECQIKATGMNDGGEFEDVTFGKNVTVKHPVNLYRCVIGDGCFIGPFVEIQRNATIGARSRVQSHSFVCELVTIGEDCFVGHGVMFINDLFKTGGPARGDDGKLLPTTIGNNVSIGSNATILPVTICDNVVIGAGAVVTKDITIPGTYIGNPARKSPI